MTWIQTEDEGPLRWLLLSNPGKKNAVPPEGWGPLQRALEDFEASDARVLIVAGEGTDFCAGAELGPEMVADTSVVARHRRMKEVAAAATALHRTTKPTLAAVDGAAVGAGMNLALGCDVVIATSRARFGELFVRRGLTVDFGGTWLLPRIVGSQRALELALSGRMVEAEEALRIGLCVEVVEPDSLRERAREAAGRFLEGAPIAQMLAKQGIQAAWEVSFPEALSWEGQSQAMCASTRDFAEGIAAFEERRQPRFEGR